MGTRETTPAGPSAKTGAWRNPHAPAAQYGSSTGFDETVGRGFAVFAWKDIGWRPGSQGILRSRFAAVRVRPAHRDEKRSEPRPEEWLLIEWPKEASEPTKYWLSNLPAAASLKSLVELAKHRWVIERDYEEPNRSWD